VRSLFALIMMACAACGPADRTASAANQAPRTASSLIVAFTGEHPLARAQALETEGRHAEAAAAAQAALASDPQLADLCFDRFTLGGAEIVLRPCAPLAGAARAQFVRDRAHALAALPGIAYAEPNLVAEP
jgi:hypothetical protein